MMERDGERGDEIKGWLQWLRDHGGTGWTDEDIQREEARRRRAELEDARRQIREAKMRQVPKVFTAARMDESTLWTDTMRMARDFGVDAVEQGQCLLFIGPPGVGKTWAAVALFMQMEDLPGRFFLFAALRRRVMDLGERRAVQEDALKTPLLVMDDFGKEYRRAGDYADCFFEELFMEREGNLRATVMTSNLEPQELAARFSPAILDRLNGPWGVKLRAAGPSIRMGASSSGRKR